MNGKLILVTVGHRGVSTTKMVSAYPDGKGGWEVPQAVLDLMAAEIGVQRGQTYTIG